MAPSRESGHTPNTPKHSAAGQGSVGSSDAKDPTDKPACAGAIDGADEADPAGRGPQEGTPATASGDLDELLHACLARPESQWRTALESACQEHPDLAPDINRRLEALRSVGLLPATDWTPNEAPTGEAPLTAAPLPQLSGFTLERHLGGGGMGVVYLACQQATGRTVAVKLLRPGLMLSEEALGRFRREMELSRHLDHPSICQVLDVGEDRGTPFIVMDYVQGETLAQWITKRRAADTPPQGRDIERLTHVFKQLAEALSTAHSTGLIHRDVKPANIILGENGCPVLLDFGLARRLDQVEERLTRTGARVGTPAYMAPELLSSSASAGASADIYSLGLTLYECLGLRLPWGAATAEGLAVQIISTTIPPIRRLNRAVSRDLATIVATALERNPEERYASAETLAADLNALDTGRPITARRPSLPRRTIAWCGANPKAATLLATLTLALGSTLYLTGKLRTTLRQTKSISLAEAAAAQLHENPDLALDLARQAVLTDATPTSRSRLQEALAAYHAYTSFDLDEVPINKLTFSGTQLVATNTNGLAKHFELRDKKWQELTPPSGAASTPSTGNAPNDDGDRWPFPDGSGSSVAIVQGNGKPTGEYLTLSTTDLDDTPHDKTLMELLPGEPTRIFFATDTATATAFFLSVHDMGVSSDAHLWSATGEHLGSVPGNAEFTPAAVDPRGNFMLGTPNGTAHLYDNRGRLLESFRGHAGHLLAMAINADGSLIATASYDRTLRIWNTAPSEDHLIARHTGAVLTVATDAAGRVLSGDDRGELRLTVLSQSGSANAPNPWTVALFAQVDHTIFLGASDSCAAFTRNGWIHIMGTDGTFQAHLSPPNPTAQAHGPGTVDLAQLPQGREATELASSADGRRLLAAYSTGQLIEWRLSANVWSPSHYDRKEAEGYQTHIRSLALSPDGKLLALCGHRTLDNGVSDTLKGWVYLTRLSPDSELLDLTNPEITDNWNHSVRFSPDGRHLISASRDNTAQLWTIADQHLSRGPRLEGHGATVAHAEFSHDGRLIATASTDNTARLWDLKGNNQLTLRAHKSAVWHLAFVPREALPNSAGPTLITASYDGTIRVWDVGEDMTSVLDKVQRLLP